MIEMLDAVADLRAFAAAEHEPGTPAARVAERIAEYLDGAADGVTLVEALRLKPGRGQSPWWKLEQREREREAAEKLVSAFGSSDAALHGLRQYEHGRGQHAAPETEYADERTQAAHDYLTVARDVPDSTRTLRRSAAASK